jgi:hypothetical protein
MFIIIYDVVVVVVVFCEKNAKELLGVVVAGWKIALVLLCVCVCVCGNSVQQQLFFIYTVSK